MSRLKKPDWQYYGVKIIKQIVVEGEPDPKLPDEQYDASPKQCFEESVLLVRAQSFEHAYTLAEKAAQKDEEPYNNSYGQRVTWKFQQAVDCFLMNDNLETGAEVYSHIHETDEGTAVDAFIRRLGYEVADR